MSVKTVHEILDALREMYETESFNHLFKVMYQANEYRAMRRELEAWFEDYTDNSD